MLLVIHFNLGSICYRHGDKDTTLTLARPNLFGVSCPIRVWDKSDMVGSRTLGAF